MVPIRTACSLPHEGRDTYTHIIHTRRTADSLEHVPAAVVLIAGTQVWAVLCRSVVGSDLLYKLTQMDVHCKAETLVCEAANG